MKSILIAIIVACFLPATALAGQLSARTPTETGWSHVMCDGEDSTGDCDLGGTDGIFAVVDMYESVTFTLSDPTTSTAICEIYAGTVSDDVPGTADLSTLGGSKINSVDLSDSQQRIIFSNISYKYMWIVCTAFDASSLIEMQGAVGRTRIAR